MSVNAANTAKQFHSKNMTDKLITIYNNIIANKPIKLRKKALIKVIIEEIKEAKAN